MGNYKKEINKGPNMDTINGIFIHRDKKNRVVYSNWFMKNGYIISRYDVKEYSFYSGRIWFSIIIAMVIYFGITKNLYICIGIPLLFYLVTTLLFYLNFLKKLVVIENYQKPKGDSFFVSKAKAQKFSALAMTMVSSAVVCILLIINAKQQNYTGFMLYASYAVAFFMFGFSIVTIITMYIKKKNNY